MITAASPSARDIRSAICDSTAKTQANVCLHAPVAKPFTPMTTTALIVILHEPKLLPRLLRAWDRANVPGVTILPSMGGFQAQKQVHRGGLGGLLNMFTPDEPGQRTLISLIDEPETLARAISEADRVVKGFDSPRSGILFTLPIDNVLGLQKWRHAPPTPEIAAPPRKEHSNLLKWFYEDVKETYGRAALTDWSDQRQLQVGEIIHTLDLDPIVVRVDTPLGEILARFCENPAVSLACVINTEERLMGIIPIAAIAEALLAPVVPEAFVDESEGYAKALQYSAPDTNLLAADIMREPVYAHTTADLVETYQRMQENGLTELPVVDQFYHVVAHITLLEMLAASFQNFDSPSQA